MSCCTRARRLSTTSKAYFASRRADSPTPRNGPIVGTWDFKWPEGAQVRVAFQRPKNISNGDFATVKGLVQALAERWHPNQTKLSFSFGLPDFGPPVDGHPQHRSNVTNEPWRLYDVLVSLEDLPLTLRDSIAGNEARVFLPQSEIGTYARRVDFGTPTMFLGRMPPNNQRWEDYYRQPLIETLVVHEFGHALGLAHEHQSPVARKKFNWSRDSYDYDKARIILIERFGVPADELPPNEPDTIDFLEGHLGVDWPGNELFSDWRSYDATTLNSIMAVPYHDCALKNSGHPSCGPTCPNINLVPHPSAADVAAITAMYT